MSRSELTMFLLEKGRSQFNFAKVAWMPLYP